LRAGAKARLSYERPADVAQLVEHFTRNEGVRGSNPRVGFNLGLRLSKKEAPLPGLQSCCGQDLDRLGEPDARSLGQLRPIAFTILGLVEFVGVGLEDRGEGIPGHACDRHRV
jgi:hypothetical protein